MTAPGDIVAYDGSAERGDGGVGEEERLARMVLSRVVEPGDLDAAELVRRFGAVALIDRLRERTAGSKLVGWSQRLQTVHVDVIAAEAARYGARYLCPGDADWPGGLLDLGRLEAGPVERRGSVPFGLWVRGNAELFSLTRLAVSIVGARASTAYGESVVKEVAEGCCERGFTVVSGGAYGIDAAAHRAALRCGGATVAVLAGGVDRLYPAGNIDLLGQVIGAGAVVSEAGPGCVPSRLRFLVRNRLIAALSGGTVVVEAALRSGSLNTARWARDLGRGVMGVPGSVRSSASAGVHELLRQPETLLVTDASEVVEHLSPAGEGLAAAKTGPVTERDRLDPLSRRVLDAVPKVRPATAASIDVAAGLAQEDTVRRLLTLQRHWLVVIHDGGWRLA